jgi:hypothetical protein
MRPTVPLLCGAPTRQEISFDATSIRALYALKRALGWILRRCGPFHLKRLFGGLLVLRPFADRRLVQGDSLALEHRHANGKAVAFIDTTRGSCCHEERLLPYEDSEAPQ